MTLKSSSTSARESIKFVHIIMLPNPDNYIVYTVITPRSIIWIKE